MLKGGQEGLLRTSPVFPIDKRLRFKKTALGSYNIISFVFFIILKKYFHLLQRFPIFSALPAEIKLKL